ncbi:MAG TPA: PQQ-binding-like beta-propeller repeat protein [Kofleriaceae bacterium]|nr:PQQ-binding-like beta-propeller repeat protein [Kofleriaceae bacterium]
MAVALAAPWTAGAAPAVQALAVDAPASAPVPAQAGSGAPAAAPMFGVRWRIAIPGAGDTMRGGPAPIVRRGEVVVAAGDTLTVLDLATGKRRRGGKLAYTRLLGGDGGLVTTTAKEEIGVDPAKLAPTWRAPVPHSLVALGDWIVEIPKHSTHKQVVRLRRASDGQVAWELEEDLDVSATARHLVAGPTIYLQLAKSVAAVESATGKLRWRRPGTLQSTSDGRVAIAAAPGQVVIVDADGHDQWTAKCQSIVLRGKTAYVTTAKAVTAIDLETNHVRWRRADLRAFASDDTWVYASPPEAEDAGPKLTVLAADTGAIAGQIPQSRAASFAVAGDGTALLVDGKWAFALGGLAKPEPVRELDAGVCLIVHGCLTHTAPLVGGKIMLGGAAAATTDRRGCVRWRGKAGLAPISLAISGGEVAGAEPQFDVPFPDTVVMDSAAVTVHAEYLGAGCHDSTHTSDFP